MAPHPKESSAVEQSNPNPEMPVSMLRILDVAHQLTAELGGWQHHPGLSLSPRNDIGGHPYLSVNLSHKTSPDEVNALLDDASLVLGVDVGVTRDDEEGDIGSLRVRDWRGTGVAVDVSGRIAAPTVVSS